MGEAGGLGGGGHGEEVGSSRRGRGSDVTLCMGDPWIGAHPLSPFAYPTMAMGPELGATDTRRRAVRRASSAAPSLRARRCLRAQALKDSQRSGRAGDCDRRGRRAARGWESQWRSAWLTNLAPAQG